MTASAGNEIREYVNKVYRSRTIPSMLGKILSLVKDENSSHRDLFPLISHDPALAERVIRVANSVTNGSCFVCGMPRAVVEAGLADKVVSIGEVAGEIVNAV